VALWPPLVIKGTAKPKAGAGVNAALLGVMKRSKTLRQVTYGGFPLYVFSGDHKTGDVKGEAFQGKWYLVNPKGALVKKAVSTSGGGTGGWG
jgi:predicted lipoprotein with Yx(FWY)xxD motif